jgi:hypothetical protein
MIGFDSNMLSLALCPNVDVAVDPETKKKIERPKERVDLLVAELDARGEKILIPMPALAEFLVLTGNASATYLDMIHKLPRFVIGEFTERAAIEVAQAIRKALDSMNPALTPPQNAAKKRDDVEATWAKVNFDRQIVAIAKVRGCSAIYSTDGHVVKHAEKMGLDCIHLADLPLPPDPLPEPQLKLFDRSHEVTPKLAPQHEDVERESHEESKTDSPAIATTPGLRRSGDGHPENQAGAEEKAEGKEAGEN